MAAIQGVELRERRCGLDRIDPDDHSLELRFIKAHLARQVGHAGLRTEFPAEQFPGGLDFAPSAANATGPRVAAQRVDHGAPHAAFGERLEFDAPPLVKAMHRIDQAKHAILDEVSEVDRMRHGGRHTACE